MTRAHVLSLVLATSLLGGLAAPAGAQDPAEAQSTDEAQGLSGGGRALGMEGGNWALSLRLGFGSDTNGGVGFNPFGSGFGPYGFLVGLNLSYTFEGAPIFIAGETAFYVGEKTAGIRSHFAQGLGWLGYHAAIRRRFVLRPAIGGGLDSLRVAGNGQGDLSIGLVGGIDLSGMIFCTDQFYIDGGMRFTWDVTKHDGAARIAGLTSYIGLGYSF